MEGLNEQEVKEFDPPSEVRISKSMSIYAADVPVQLFYLMKDIFNFRSEQ